MSEDAEGPGEETTRPEGDAERFGGPGAGPPEPVADPDAGGATDGGGEGEGATAAESEEPRGEQWTEETETVYEPLEGGGHRVTRRTTRRRVTVEDVSEEITEDLPPQAYRAPRTSTHPAPVG